MTTLAEAIAQMEGFNTPGTVAQRNDNPGNLRFVGQAGATGKDSKGFAIFPTAEEGWQALQAQIALDAGRGLTLTQFMGKYAPPSENDTGGYISFVSKKTGIGANDLISGFLKG